MRDFTAWLLCVRYYPNIQSLRRIARHINWFLGSLIPYLLNWWHFSSINTIPLRSTPFIGEETEAQKNVFKATQWQPALKCFCPFDGSVSKQCLNKIASFFEGEMKLRLTRKCNKTPLSSRADFKVKIKWTCVSNSLWHSLNSSLTGRINVRGRRNITLISF